MEKHYVFIKDNRVVNSAVFAEQNDELANAIVAEQGYDSFVWLDDAAIPSKWSSYDGSLFTAPTVDYLISIGVITPTPEELPNP